MIRCLSLYIKQLVCAELARVSAGPPEGTRIRHDRTGLASGRALEAIHSGALAAVKVGKFYYIEPTVLRDYFAAYGKAKSAASEEREEFAAAAKRGFRKGAAPSPRR